jgi:DNA-binding MarR family transcriptional regulator
MSDTKRDDPVHFRFMNEIAIIDQLGSRIFERVMPDGMTLPQFAVLNHFVRLQRPSSPQKLASAFQVTKGAMTNTLQHLESKGYVRVAPDEKDRRAKVVTITPQGSAARDAAIAALDPILRSMASEISATDIEAALSVLVRVRGFLDAERDGR